LASWRPVLLPRQSFELHTQIVGWDEKWFFIEQKITRDGKLITVALFKCVAQKQGGPKPSGFAPPAELFAKAYGRRVESPKLPRAVHAWVAALAIEKQELAA